MVVETVAGSRWKETGDWLPLRLVNERKEILCAMNDDQKIRGSGGGLAEQNYFPSSTKLTGAMGV